VFVVAMQDFLGFRGINFEDGVDDRVVLSQRLLFGVSPCRSG